MFNNIFKILKVSNSKPQQSMYSIIGEEKGTYELVRNFYDIMETSPKAKECLEVHDLVNGTIPDEVKKKLFMFLCGWFGGPNLFVEAYGHPRMRARHMHIKIGVVHRDQWLYCIEKALKIHSFKISRRNKKIILNSFKALAYRIQNIN